MCLRNQELLPLSCKACSLYTICGGGYMPHRWKSQTGFSNPSVHCNDLYDVITHIHTRVVKDLTVSKVNFQTGT